MASHIPIVQGVAVPSGGASATPYSAAPSAGNADEGVREFNGVKGDPQPKKFNDVAFAILFWLHLAVMIVLLSMGTVQYQGNGSDYTGLAICVVVCGAVAIGLATLALSFMYIFASAMVKISLIFSVLSSALIGVLGAMTGDVLLIVMGFAGFLIGMCYAKLVWPRIPFASANLRTALTAVKQNMGLAVVAYFFCFVAFAWSVFWVVGLTSSMMTIGQGIIFLYLVSFYWVHQVLVNTVHTTTAGTVGTWWFVPSEASSFCSSAVKDSFTRATTYSFGSICFGSLIVAIVQALRALQQQAQNSDDCQILACIIGCILACIQGIIEYFNKFAFIYVGLYGYSFLDAGRNVITLFQNKGWTTIITDDLSDNVLWLMSIGIALASGLVGFVMGAANQAMFSGIGYDQNGGTVGFIIGLLVGYLFSSIMMAVVGSGVSTAIVCFAEAPAEFEANHPELSLEMRSAWQQAWPTEFGG
jgi:hypothetical protein